MQTTESADMPSHRRRPSMSVQMTTFVFFILLLNCCSALSGQESKALIELRKTWNVTDWKGDPNCSAWSSAGHINCNEDQHVSTLDFGFARPELLSGAIPKAVCWLVYLEELKLYGNRLSGPIPTCLGNLTQLRYLDLSGNCLGGQIPFSLGNLVKMEYFDLSVNSHNNFSFSQRELCNKSNQSNGLVGSIPDSLGNMTKAKYFYLSGNKLTGPIPESIGQLKSAMYIYINANNLTGRIPSTIGKLESLQDLQLNKNQLSGKIPPEIGNCSSLRILQVNRNHLSGPIPDTIGNLAQLQALELLGNKIEGQIPEFKTTPVLDLNLFDLRENNLSGTLPRSFQDAPLRYLFVTNNKQMRGTNSSLPAYIEPDYTSRSVLDLTRQFECPGYSILSRTFKVTLPLIEIDPEYYSFTLCSCRPGFYGNPPDACKACLHNGDCRNGGLMKFPLGFYPVGAPGTVKEFRACKWVNAHFSPCNPNGNCIVGRHGLEASAGKSSAGKFSAGKSSAVKSSAGKSSAGHCIVCAEGYEGRLCSKCSCKDKSSCYFHSHAECVSCKTFSTMELILMSFIVVLVIVLFAFFRKSALARLAFSIVLAVVALSLNAGSWLTFNILLIFILLIPLTGKGNSSGLIKSLIFYCQTIASLLPTVMPVEIHRVLQNLAQTFNFTNLKIVGMVCLFPHFLGESPYAMFRGFLLSLCAPVFIFSLVTILLSVKRINCCRSKPPTLQPTSLKHEILSCAIFIAHFSFFNASKLIISVFNCSKDGSGDSFMNAAAYQTVKCSGDEWSNMVKLAAAAAVVFLLVPVVAFTVMLIRNRRRVNDDVVSSWLGFLYTSYKPIDDENDNRSWFRRKLWLYSEIFFMLYRFALALTISLPQGDSGPTWIMIMLTASLPLVFFLKPFTQTVDNNAAMATILSLVVTLFISKGVNHTTPGLMLPWLMLMLVNVPTILLFIVAIVWRGREEFLQNLTKVKESVVTGYRWARSIKDRILKRSSDRDRLIVQN